MYFFLVKIICVTQLVLSVSTFSQEKESVVETPFKIDFSKTVTLDISEGFPKLQGNPLFFSDENSSYFFIQSGEGIGTFDLEKGGRPIAILKMAEIENFRGGQFTSQNHFIPTSKNSFLYFDRMNDEINVIEDRELLNSQKLARIVGDNPKPQTGFLQFAIKEEQVVSVLNMLEIYGKPPFKYQELSNSIGIFKNDLREFESKIKLPQEYLGKNVNVYDLLISLAYNKNSKEYIINYPILDDLIVTKDFEEIVRLKATPMNQFVKLSNRSGEKMGEWRKEFYTENSFLTVYYDSYRDLYIRHYREGLSDLDYESLVGNSYKMLDPKHRNYLLFMDRSGKELHRMEISEFNHMYIHFGKEGMYILNDTELEDEDTLTFSLFTIHGY